MTPITEKWLWEHGWRATSDDGRRLDIGRETQGEKAFRSSDDLCIRVGKFSALREWGCWIVQIEPRRSIFVREVKYTEELVQLWEALTGKEWVENPRTDAENFNPIWNTMEQ